MKMMMTTITMVMVMMVQLMIIIDILMMIPHMPTTAAECITYRPPNTRLNPLTMAAPPLEAMASQQCRRRSGSRANDDVNWDTPQEGDALSKPCSLCDGTAQRIAHTAHRLTHMPLQNKNTSPQIRQHPPLREAGAVGTS